MDGYLLRALFDNRKGTIAPSQYREVGYACPRHLELTRTAMITTSSPQEQEVGSGKLGLQQWLEENVSTMVVRSTNLKSSTASNTSAVAKTSEMYNFSLRLLT